MENWNITKRDLEQITRMQGRIDRIPFRGLFVVVGIVLIAYYSNQIKF